MRNMTTQFRNTAIHLMIDVSEALGQSVRDGVWAEGFLFPMIGSLGHECGGFALMEEGSPLVKGSLGGISFAQWTGMGKRRRGLFMNFCRKNKLHPYSYEAAIGFIIVELTGAYKHVVQATLRTQVTKNTPKPKDALMARVVRFEQLYEGAAVKHYPSRYEYAAMAQQLWHTWVQMGCTAPGPYVMPKARFSADFDAEFGSGLGPKTTRAQNNPFKQGNISVASAPEPKPEPPLAGLAPRAVGGVQIPGVTFRNGRWPEMFLSKQEIAVIQTRLRDLGYVRLGTVNGLWDSDMVATISKLQSNAGIAVDGHWGGDTQAALITGYPEQVQPERALATKDTLKDVGEPVIVKTDPVKKGAWWSTLGSAGAAAVAGAGSMFQTAKDYIAPVQELVSDVPGWVWFVAVAVLAYALYRRLNSVQGTVVDGFRKGEVLTVEKPPALPPGVTQQNNPVPWENMKPGDRIGTLGEVRTARDSIIGAVWDEGGPSPLRYGVMPADRDFSPFTYGDNLFIRNHNDRTPYQTTFKDEVSK